MKKYIPPILLVFILIGAFVYRIEHMQNTQILAPIRSDAKQYTAYALNILHFNTHSSNYDPLKKPEPDNWRTPGYPFFLAFIIKLAGEQNFYGTTRLVQSFFGTAAVLLTYLIARFFLPYWASLLASFFVALSPHLISLENYILTETLFSFFLLFSIYMFFLAHKTKKTYIFLIAGGIFGFTYLINPTIFFVPLFLAIVILATTKMPTKKQLLPVTLFCLVFLLMVAGYGVRNHLNVPPEKRQDRLIGNICCGTYPNFIYKSERYKYFMYKEDPEYENCASSLQGLQTMLWDRFKVSPGKYLKWYFIGKPIAYWGWDILQGFGDVYIYEPITTLFNKSTWAKFLHDFMRWLHPILLLLFLFGIMIHLFLLKDRKHKVQLYSIMIFIVPIYYTALFIIFFPLPRYAIPIRPELYLCGAWTLNYLAKLPGFRGIALNINTNQQQKGKQIL